MGSVENGELIWVQCSLSVNALPHALSITVALCALHVVVIREWVMGLYGEKDARRTSLQSALMSESQAEGKWKIRDRAKTISRPYVRLVKKVRKRERRLEEKGIIWWMQICYHVCLHFGVYWAAGGVEFSHPFFHSLRHLSYADAGDARLGAGYTLNRMPAHHRAESHTYSHTHKQFMELAESLD